MDQLIYIGAALAIGLLIGFVALCVLWLGRTMRRNVRSHTLNLLSAYDDLLEEKSRELSEMEEKLRQKAALTEKPEAEPAPVPAAREPEFRLSTGAVLAVSQRAAEVSYRDKTVGDTYRQIRDSFSFDLEELLPLLQGEQQPGPAEKLLAQLDFDTVYRLSTLTEAQQLSVLQESLDGEGKALLEGYLRNGRPFRVLEFYSALQSQAAAESKAVRLYVPKSMARGTSGSLQVVADPDICEGFQAELGGRLYDYSIKTRELS